MSIIIIKVGNADSIEVVNVSLIKVDFLLSLSICCDCAHSEENITY